MEAIKNKGHGYIALMPRNRILTTLVNFDIAVLLFVIVDLLMSVPITPSQVLQSLIGWGSVGNSNWYIFDIILCYLITYVVFRYFVGYPLLFGMGIFLVVVVVLAECKPPHWSNTLLAYFAGIVFSAYKEKLVVYMKKYYWIALVTSLSMFVAVKILFKGDFSAWCIRDNVCSVLFALLVVLITMKIQMQNKVLIWLGKGLFPLYIYQRMPMIIFYELDGGIFVRNHVLVYMAICLIVTVGIAFFYRYWNVGSRCKSDAK